uniref:Putative secreted protein n=1 Tax=Rhipicephalus microplus TaxID=6941 RepID=A0A6G5A1R0_RHIMP
MNLFYLQVHILIVVLLHSRLFGFMYINSNQCLTRGKKRNICASPIFRALWSMANTLCINNQLVKIIDNALGSNSHIMQVIIFFVIENKMEGIAITSHHVLPGKIPQNRVNECLRLQNSQ